jgi:trk system potassium uptake protein TrkH
LLDIQAAVASKQRLSAHSVMTLGTMAVVYVLGTLAIFGLQWMSSTGDPTFSQTLAVSSATSVNARTAGLPFQLASQVARPAQWVVMLLMVIGAASGGAGGGLKTTTPAVLCRGLWSVFRGKAPSRIFAIASIWTLAYALVVFIPFLFLLNSEPDLDADKLLFIVVSAASNVGLSHERISIAGGGQITLCVTMLLGRLLPLAVLWWTAMTVREADGIAVG